MEVANWLAFFGGLAIFLYGMHLMGDSLSAIGGGKLESFLEKATSNPIKAVLIGAGITALIHSSGATTVMVVGFVNSSLLNLEQAASVIMGANIGTTITAWILSLTGLSGDNIIVMLLKPATFAPVCAIVGVVLATIIKKNERQKNIGFALFGFGALMMGMTFMTDAVSPLSQDPAFINLFASLTNPLLGLLVGIGFTAAVQSSSASMGILQALMMSGTISYGATLPIIMGQNIGTCITAMISSIGGSKNAKRAAVMHMYFNIIGTIIFLILIYVTDMILPGHWLSNPATPLGISIFHTVFNSVTTAVLLPNRKFLVKLACLTVRGDDEDNKNQTADEKELARLDERFLLKPGIAFEQCKYVCNRMSELSKKAVSLADSLLFNWDQKVADEVIKIESEVDIYEDKLGSYLLKLASKDLNKKESEIQGLYLKAIGDFERISDHATNILESAQEMHEKREQFSPTVQKEVKTFCSAVEEILDMTGTAFENNDTDLAKKVEPLEEVVDGLSVQLKDRRIRYLASGQCTMIVSFVLSDLNIYLERISDHCSSLAIALIEVGEDSFDMNEYLEKIKNEKSKEFIEEFKKYAEKYKLPERDIEREKIQACQLEDKDSKEEKKQKKDKKK